jgi:hypothetical protein
VLFTNDFATMSITTDHVSYSRKPDRIFRRRSQKASRAFSDFKKQLDYLVWGVVRYRLRFCLFRCELDPLHVEMTALRGSADAALEDAEYVVYLVEQDYGETSC